MCHHRGYPLSEREWEAELARYAAELEAEADEEADDETEKPWDDRDPDMPVPTPSDD